MPSEDHNQKLLENVLNHNEIEVHSALEAGGNPNLIINADYGHTALHYAAIKGYAVIVQYLLDHGADPNVQARDGLTPLHQAIANNRTDVAIHLIHRGASPHITDSLNELPLHLAALNENSIVIEALMAAGADLNAALCGPTLRQIFQRCKPKAYFDAVDRRLIQEIYDAVQGKKKIDREKIRAALLQGGDINTKMGPFHNTPLHWAAQVGDQELVETLLDWDADPNSKNVSNYTPLHLVTQYNPNAAVMNKLIEYGADVYAKANTGGPIGQTPRQLLKIYHPDNKYFDPADYNILKAAEAGDTNEIQKQLDLGADVNALSGWYHYRPLHYASGNAHIEAVKLLLKNGADINARTTVNRYTPLDLAKTNKTTASITVQNILMNWGGKALKTEEELEVIRQAAARQAEKLARKREKKECARAAAWYPTMSFVPQRDYLEERRQSIERHSFKPEFYKREPSIQPMRVHYSSTSYHPSKDAISSETRSPSIQTYYQGSTAPRSSSTAIIHQNLSSSSGKSSGHATSITAPLRSSGGVSSGCSSVAATSHRSVAEHLAKFGIGAAVSYATGGSVLAGAAAKWILSSSPAY